MKGALRWLGKVLLREDVPWTPDQFRRTRVLAASRLAVETAAGPSTATEASHLEPAAVWSIEDIVARIVRV